MHFNKYGTINLVSVYSEWIDVKDVCLSHDNHTKAIHSIGMTPAVRQGAPVYVAYQEEHPTSSTCSSITSSCCGASSSFLTSQTTATACWNGAKHLEAV